MSMGQVLIFEPIQRDFWHPCVAAQQRSVCFHKKDLPGKERVVWKIHLNLRKERSAWSIYVGDYIWRQSLAWNEETWRTFDVVSVVRDSKQLRMNGVVNKKMDRSHVTSHSVHRWKWKSFSLMSFLINTLTNPRWHIFLVFQVWCSNGRGV